MAVSAQLSTARLYYQEAYLTAVQATITAVGNENNSHYIVTDKTIFHAQGGGQPNDKGKIVINGQELPVTGLKEEGDAIKHYYTVLDPDLLKVGMEVGLAIDSEWRTSLMKVHSTGHLIEDAVHVLYPQLEAYKGRHDLDGAAVNFKVSEEELKAFNFEEAKLEIGKKVNQFVQDGIPLYQGYDNGKRWVRFGNHLMCFCGGTHVANSREIGGMSIRYVKKEKMDVKIGYDVLRNVGSSSQ